MKEIIMPAGLNQAPNHLWKLRFKVNTPDGGLNWMLHIAEKTFADAHTIAVDIASRYRALMPETCEVYHCTLSRDNPKKDSRIVTAGLGDGLYHFEEVVENVSTYNRFDDVLLVRFENQDGWGITHKIGPVPDGIIIAGEVPLPPASVTDIAPAVAAQVAQPIVYATEFTKLMHAIAKNTHHLQTAEHTPGEGYIYFNFERAHFIRAGKKKGGRVFTK